jgi:outer membrane lipoprotein-sorting protein
MRLLTTIMMLALFAVPAHAYEIVNLRADMKAHIEKMLKEVGDVTIQQQATFEAGEAGMGGMTATTYVKGNRWRSDAKMKGSRKGQDMEMDVTSLFDGTDMWSVTMGMKHKLPKGTMGQGPQGLWNEIPENAKLLGAEQVSGRAAWKLQYEAAKGAPKSSEGVTTLWLDKSTYMPIQMEMDSFGKPVRMVMSDFRKVKGYDIAHLTEMFTDGKKSMTMKVLKLETNKGLSDDLFDPDQLAGGEGMDMNDMMKKAMEMQKQMEAQTKKGGE